MMKKIRVHDEKGRERWMSPGDIIPIGWYDVNNEKLTLPHIVAVTINKKNPYNPTLYLKPYQGGV